MHESRQQRRLAARERVRRRRRLLVGGAIGLVAALLALGLALAALGDRDYIPGFDRESPLAGDRPESIEMPDVIGMDAVEAERMLRDMRLLVRSVRVDSERPVGEVLTQDPEPGEDARVGSAVRIDASRGSGDERRPSGPVTDERVGPVELGMTWMQVVDRFGEPDEERGVPREGGPQVEYDWTWELGGGELTLRFSLSDNRLTAIENTSDELG